MFTSVGFPLFQALVKLPQPIVRRRELPAEHGFERVADVVADPVDDAALHLVRLQLAEDAAVIGVDLAGQVAATGHRLGDLLRPPGHGADRVVVRVPRRDEPGHAAGGEDGAPGRILRHAEEERAKPAFPIGVDRAGDHDRRNGARPDDSDRAERRRQLGVRGHLGLADRAVDAGRVDRAVEDQLYRTLVPAAADDAFLYVETGAVGTVDEFRVNDDGTLTRLGTVTGLPAPPPPRPPPNGLAAPCPATQAFCNCRGSGYLVARPFKSPAVEWQRAQTRSK